MSCLCKNFSEEDLEILKEMIQIEKRRRESYKYVKKCEYCHISELRTYLEVYKEGYYCSVCIVRLEDIEENNITIEENYNRYA